MSSRGGSSPQAAGGRPLYVVGASEVDGQSPFVSRLADRQSAGRVETLTPAALAARDTTTDSAGVVCRTSTTDDLDAPALVETITTDAPVVVVGTDSDPAALYRAGATEVVPLDAATAPDAAAMQAAQTVDRHHERQPAVAAVDTDGAGLIVHDPDSGAIRAVNDRLRQLLGFGRDREVTLDDVTGANPEFSRERAVSLVRDAADGRPRTFEWIEPDGVETTWVEVSLERSTVGGERVVLGTVRDVPDRSDAGGSVPAPTSDAVATTGAVPSPAEGVGPLPGRPDRARARRDGTRATAGGVGETPVAAETQETAAATETQERAVTTETEETAVATETEENVVTADAAETTRQTRAFDRVDDAFLSVDEDWCVEYVNDAGRRLFADAAGRDDWREMNPTGTSLWELIPDEVVANARDRLVRANEIGEPVEFEQQCPQIDGWFDVCAYPGDDDGVSIYLHDATARKMKQIELRHARERVEQLLDRVDDAFFALTPEWEVSYANTDGAAVLREAAGMAEAEPVVGMAIWEEIADEAATAFEERYRYAMREQESVTFVERYEPMGVWFEVRAYPDDEGLSVYFTDVTERKEREREMERFGEVLGGLDDGVYAVDADDELVYVNDEFAAMEGVDRETLLGTRLDEWVTDQSRDCVRDVRERAADAEGVAQVECSYRPTNGEEFPAELRISTVSQAGSDLGRVGVVRDVTERTERERELRIREQAIEESALAITLADATEPDTPLTYVNESFESLTGYDEADVLGRNCRFLQGPETDDETVANLREAVAAGEHVSTEVRNYTADGEPFWNRVEITPIHDGDGNVVRFLGTQTDVSEERRVRQVRKRMLATTRGMLSAESPTEIAELVVEAAGSVLDHEFSGVYLADDDGDLEPVAWSDSVDEVFGGPSLARPNDAVQTAHETGQPATYTDMEAALGSRAANYPELESLQVVPMGGAGVFVAGSSEEYGFDDGDVDLAQLLTVNATVALERARRVQDLVEYETLFDTVEDKLYVLDADGYFQLVSDPLARRLGYEPDALTGEHVSTVLTDETVAAGTNTLVERLRESAGEEIATDGLGVGASGYEGAAVTNDGERVPVEIDLSLLPTDDGFRGSVGAVRDISERRRSQDELAAFRDAITESGVGVALYDDAGRITYANDHYAGLLGESREAVESGRVWNRVADLTYESFADHWASFANNETRQRETELVRADGTTAPVETTTTATEIGGSLTHVQTVREITGRRERRQQVDTLHRVIRHNLRNDMTVVLGHANRLVEDLDGSVAESAEMIAKTAEELVDLSGSVRDAEAILDGEIVRRPTDAVRVVGNAVDWLADEHAVTPTTDLPETAAVLADETLSLALRHLLENAAEHGAGGHTTPSGEGNDDPDVSVSVAEMPERTGWVTVEIADDGPGIPDQEWEVLSAGEETQLDHGSGMGLWIVHWIVSRYGGELEFDADDTGTTARIALPTPDADDVSV
ncbi:PAS domain S-box protein, partial [Halobaculum sp. MBLA0147]|uniref:PAS domain S-box protein n=1 Tax=Halobaculum sp. MBLA0147 TaxID=3079934 RepID=UPI003524F80D